MREKFTKGPWKITEEDWEAKGDTTVIYDNDGEEVLGIIGYIKIDDPDLQLIADAWQLPELRREIVELKAINKEMCEALECACDRYCIGYAGDSIVKCEDCIISNALRKTRGEAE